MAVKAFYCVGTHWDREWYEPFQEFRMWLVELIDELIELMARDPKYRCFHLDGQAVVLQDYLEIRPERREALVGLLKEGRLIAGPWYVLPDEWLISGESYVRNVMMGMRACRELGVEPMKFAYTPDQFGHIAALPMIMTGFGLRAGICWRGTQDENFPAQFVWVGPDGSRMVTHKLRDPDGYGPFDTCVRRRMKDVGSIEEGLTTYFDPFMANESGRARIPLVLMLDALDHQRPDPSMPRLFEELEKRYPDIAFTWTSLEAYGEAMVAQADALPEYRGELREPSRAADRNWQYLIVHVLSSRYPIKKSNDECQALLEKWAEPYALYEQMAGGAPILRYLGTAWEHLVKNHPHDSICGCSIDQVHRDMQYRFDQCAGIADGVVRRAMASVAHAAVSDEALANVVVHNPLPFARDGVFQIPVFFPQEWSKTFVDGLTSGERLNKFALVDKGGKRLPFQLSAVERGVTQKRLSDIGRKVTMGGDVYHLAVQMELPAGGFTGFRVEPVDEATRNFGSLMTGPLSASNRLIDFALRPDGTGTLAHRSSGRTYDGLFLYEDCGDSGDGWTRGQLINDIVFRSPGTRVTTAIDEDGPLRTVFRVEREFDLPRMMDRKTGWRSEDRRALRVTDLMYVEKGQECLRVRTRVCNACQDHRFRVLFPTHIECNTSFAETPFAVVERDIAIPEETKTWHERVNPEKAFTTFFGVGDPKGGLSVLAPFGLHEYEVFPTPDRTLALTLFRSTFTTVGTNGEPDGELMDDLDFEYLLYPFAGRFDPVRAARFVAEAQAGVRVHHAAELPEPRSFMELSKGAAIVTAIKPAADGNGGVVRLWNPGTETVSDEIWLGCPVQSATLCDLDERPAEEVPLKGDRTIPVTVPAGGLTTVRFTWVL